MFRLKFSNIIRSYVGKWFCESSMKGCLYISIYCFVIFTFNVDSSVKSSNGNIRFYTNSNSSDKYIINTTGLGVGTILPQSNLHVDGNALISNSLHVGDVYGQSNLNISGTVGFSLETLSSNTTLSTNSFIMADCSLQDVLVTLPYPGNCIGRVYGVKKIDSINSLYINGGGNSIDDLGALEITSANNTLPYIEVISSSDKWNIIGSYSSFDTIASGNLIAWWKLDENDGVVVSDSSLNDHSGSKYNSDYGTSGNGWVSGWSGSAIQFDGIDDHLDMGNKFSLSSSDFTISFWLRYDSGSAHTDRVMDKNGASGWDIIWFNTSKIYFESKNGTWKGVGSSNSLSNGFNHIAFVKSGVTMSVYLNGVLDNSGSMHADVADSAENLNIGSNGSGLYLHGAIDDIRFYNKALSSIEIKSLSN